MSAITIRSQFKRLAKSNEAAEPIENTPLLASQERYREAPLYVRWPTYFVNFTWNTLAMSYVNILLIFVPLGIAAGVAKWSPTVIFILNFFAIIPLTKLLSFASEEISVNLGLAVGGLMNAIFGNAVELILGIILLRDNQIRIIQSSMLGSILYNILLVLGCCFIAGGIRVAELTFNTTVISAMSSLMTVATASLMIPMILYAVLAESRSGGEVNILILSHGTAIILLVLYVEYLFFQLKSHTHLFDDEQSHMEEEEVDWEGEYYLSPWSAGLMLILVVMLVYVCVECLTDNIDSIVETTGTSKTFIGLILIPFISNASEHVDTIKVAYRNKMDLVIGVAIGSSMQIALLVVPFLVILGWIMDRQMTLHFQTFETAVFFLAVSVVNYLLQDGKANYLVGSMLLGMYMIVALAFYVYPDDPLPFISESLD